MSNGSGYIGKQVGNYSLIKELPSGGFGSVYQGQHLIFTERIVAIKLLHAYLAAQEENERFLQEARFLEKLKHSNILPIIDAGIQDGVPYLVAEYAANGSLRDRLRRQSARPLPVEEAVTILSQIGQALQYAHQQNIVHRDLKPENILFNAGGEALLADFGLALVLEKTRSVDVTGTPSYMAPEQFRGEISKKSDQYALGCIAYELFTGQKAFTAPDIYALWYQHLHEQPPAPRQLNPQLPVHIEQAILKAMAKERASRHTDVSTFIACMSVPASKTKEQWVNEGNTHYGAGRYQEALLAFERAIELDRYYVDAYLGKCIALRMLKRYEEALAACEWALQLDPNNARAHAARGDVLWKLNRHAEALLANERAIQLVPHYAIAHSNKGDALVGLNRHTEALAAYDRALQLDPALAAAYTGKGNTFYAFRRHGEALAAFEQAIRLDPSDVDAYLGKGNVLWMLRQYEGALAAYERAIELDPGSALAYNGKGIALRMLGRYVEALAADERAIQLDPNNALFHTNKGDVLWKLNRHAEAIAANERAIQLAPHYAIAYSNKGDALAGLGRYGEALAAYEQALQLDPTLTTAYIGKGNALRSINRYKEALDAFERAIQLDSSDPDAYYGKGIVLQLLGKSKEAQQAYEKAMQLGYRG